MVGQSFAERITIWRALSPGWGVPRSLSSAKGLILGRAGLHCRHRGRCRGRDDTGSALARRNQAPLMHGPESPGRGMPHGFTWQLN
jgi:hypothetical protein